MSKRNNYRKVKYSTFNWPASKSDILNYNLSNRDNNYFSNRNKYSPNNKNICFNKKSINTSNFKNEGLIDNINNTNILNSEDKTNDNKKYKKKIKNYKNKRFNYKENDQNKFINRKRYPNNYNNNYDYNANSYDLTSNISYNSISDYKYLILEKIKNNNIIIIRGNTGCGKSTQIPQYLYNNDNTKKIIITQPRRISTISLANRIAEEMGVKLGEEIGYQVMMESKINDNTKIFIKTNGIFFEELIHNKNIPYHYIILDEIHESDIYSELLLSFFKKYISKGKNINFKLIIMSATIKKDLINYFISDKITKKTISCIDIKYPDKYKIYEHNLNDIYKKLIKMDFLSKDIQTQIKTLYEKLECSINNNQLFVYLKPIFMKNLCPFVIAILESIEYESKQNNSGVLIFLPGIEQIKYLNNYIINYRKKTKKLGIFNIIILHSLLNFTEQKKIFENNNDTINLILSTNIAETSITIPKLNFVIDFCLVKQLKYDENNNIKFLELNWYSKTNYIQRKGRIGRISTGYYLKLIPKTLFDQLDEFPKSEILSKTLEIPILKLYLYTNNFNSSIEIIKNCFNVPSEKVINNSFNILENMGALIKNNKVDEFDNIDFLNDNKNNQYDYILTNVGKIFTELPLELKYSRLIVISYCLGNINLGITLASILSQEKSIFINSNNNYSNYLIMQEYSDENDFIALLYIYKQCFYMLKNYINDDTVILDNINLNINQEVKNYLNEKGIDIFVFQQVFMTEIYLKKKLTELSLYNINLDEYENNILIYDDKNKLILNAILVGAFYNQIYTPQYKHINDIGLNIIEEKNTDENLYTIYIDYNNKKDLVTALNNIIGENNYELKYFKNNNFNFSIHLKSFNDLKKLLLSVYYEIDINDNKKYYYLDYIDEFNNVKSLKFEKSFEYYYDLKYIDNNNKQIFPNKDSINFIKIYPNYENLKNSKFITNDFIYKVFTKDCYEKSYAIYTKYTSELLSEFENLMILIFSPKFKLINNDQYKNEYKSIKINNMEINFDFIITNYHILLINKIRLLINNIINFGLNTKNDFKYNKNAVENLGNDLDNKLFGDYNKYNEYKKMYEEIINQILFLFNNVKLIRNLKRKSFVNIYNFTYGIINENINYFTNNNKIENKYFGLKLNSFKYNPFEGYINEINNLKNGEKEEDFLKLIDPSNNIKEYYLDKEEINKFIIKHNFRIKNLYYNYIETMEYIRELLYYNESYILCYICKSEICQVNDKLHVINNTIEYTPSFINNIIETNEIFDSKDNNKILELIKKNKIQYYKLLYCRNGHLFGYTKESNQSYYMFVNNKLLIKYPNLLDETIYVNDISTSLYNIQKKTKSINEIKENNDFKNNLRCELCGVGFNFYNAFITHINGDNHKNNMAKFLEEMI